MGRVQLVKLSVNGISSDAVSAPGHPNLWKTIEQTCGSLRFFRSQALVIEWASDVEESKLPIDEESKLSDEKPSRAENCLNGTSSDPSWPQPKVVFASNKLARPDMGHYSKTATIFKDPASTLILKVKQMAILI